LGHVRRASPLRHVRRRNRHKVRPWGQRRGIVKSPQLKRGAVWLNSVSTIVDKFALETEDNLLRQVVYEGLREDKPAAEVRRDVPHAKAVAAAKK
jgi:hypothetical protein